MGVVYKDARIQEDILVFYLDIANGGKLNKVLLDDGKSERLTELPVLAGFDISPDGKLVAFPTVASPSNPKVVTGLVAADSPPSPKFLAIERPIRRDPRFTHDGKGLLCPFRDRDADDLWLQPIDGSPGKQITNFQSEQIVDFHWSFDGSKLALIRSPHRFRRRPDPRLREVDIAADSHLPSRSKKEIRIDMMDEVRFGVKML